MALYRFPESGLNSIISHVTAYGIVINSLSPDRQLEELRYIMDIEGEIPDSELPHLIAGEKLEVM